jgi:hypothetical protein
LAEESENCTPLLLRLDYDGAVVATK